MSSTVGPNSDIKAASKPDKTVNDAVILPQKGALKTHQVSIIQINIKNPESLKQLDEEITKTKTSLEKASKREKMLNKAFWVALFIGAILVFAIAGVAVVTNPLLLLILVPILLVPIGISVKGMIARKEAQQIKTNLNELASLKSDLATTDFQDFVKYRNDNTYTIFELKYISAVFSHYRHIKSEEGKREGISEERDYKKPIFINLKNEESIKQLPIEVAQRDTGLRNQDEYDLNKLNELVKKEEFLSFVEQNFKEDKGHTIYELSYIGWIFEHHLYMQHAFNLKDSERS